MTDTPTSWITRTGVVRIDQRYQDARRDQPRVLRVKTITVRPGRGQNPDIADVTCSVTRTGTDGQIETMRDTTLTAQRLTSSSFLLLAEVNA